MYILSGLADWARGWGWSQKWEQRAGTKAWLSFSPHSTRETYMILNTSLFYWITIRERCVSGHTLCKAFMLLQYLTKCWKADICICLYLSFSIGILSDSVRPPPLLTCYCFVQHWKYLHIFSFGNDVTEFIVRSRIKNKKFSIIFLYHPPCSKTRGSLMGLKLCDTLSLVAIMKSC